MLKKIKYLKTQVKSCDKEIKGITELSPVLLGLKTQHLVFRDHEGRNLSYARLVFGTPVRLLVEVPD